MVEIKIKNDIGLDKDDISIPIMCGNDKDVMMNRFSRTFSFPQDEGAIIGHIKDVTKEDITMILYCDAYIKFGKREKATKAVLLAF